MKKILNFSCKYGTRGNGTMFLSNWKNYSVRAARILISLAGYKQVPFSIKNRNQFSGRQETDREPT